MIATVGLKPAKERSLQNFHPWVFSGAVATHVKDIPEGEVVDVLSVDGRFLARGHFHLGSIMVRVLSFRQEPIDAAFFAGKFSNALNARKCFHLPSATTNSYRLIHGEGDGLPGLIIDIYDKCAVIQTHTTGMARSVEMIAEGLMTVQGLSLDTLYTKHAEGPGKGGIFKDGFLKGSQTDAEILENGNRFYVDWINGQKTGFFLDQRENRKLLGTYAKDKSVLNTFCYSGGFSVYAIAGGAANVDSVDSSAKAMEWTSRNIAMNNPAGTPHGAYTADVFEHLKSAGSEYDVIILDPPAFAKRLQAVDQAVIGYRNLNFEALSRIKPGGIIFTFSCSQAVDTLLFRKTVFTAAAKARRQVRILHQLTQGPDHPVSLYHPEGEYLKGLVLQVD